MSTINKPIEEKGWNNESLSRAELVAQNIHYAFSFSTHKPGSLVPAAELDDIFPVDDNFTQASIAWADLRACNYNLRNSVSKDTQLATTLACVSPALVPAELSDERTVATTARYMRAMQSGIHARFTRIGIAETARDDSEAYTARLLSNARQVLDESSVDAFDQALEVAKLKFGAMYRARFIAQTIRGTLVN